VPSRVIETQLNERAAEPISARMYLDGYPAQAPSRVALRPGQRFAADGRSGDHPIALINGEVQRRRIIVASKSARVRLIVEQDRAPKRYNVFG